VTFVRVIVAMLVVGVTALATDAQSLACEFLCARTQAGAAAPHNHSATASNVHATHSEQMGHAGEMHRHASQDAEPSSQGLEQCVTVDDVTLRATMTREVAQPFVVIGQSAESTLAPVTYLGVSTAVAGSPPARNGPLQASSILRI
jgi:hypothetical protein